MGDNHQEQPCMTVMEISESGGSLPDELRSHALACEDCRAVNAIDNVLKNYSPLPIPGYSAARLWQRIGARDQHLPTGIPRFAFAAAAVFFILLLVLPIVISHMNRVPSLTKTSILQPTVAVISLNGTATFQSGSGVVWKRLGLKQRLAASSRIKIYGGGSLTLSFPDGSKASFVGNTDVDIIQIASVQQGTNNFFLRNGKVFVKHEQGPMLVATPLLKLEPVGTVFSVEQDMQGTRVSVYGGSVRVLGGHGEVRLVKGQHMVANHAFVRVRRFHIKQIRGWERAQLKTLGIPLEQFGFRGNVKPERLMNFERVYDLKLTKQRVKIERLELRENQRVGKRTEKLTNIQQMNDQATEKQAKKMEEWIEKENNKQEKQSETLLKQQQEFDKQQAKEHEKIGK